MAIAFKTGGGGGLDYNNYEEQQRKIQHAIRQRRSRNVDSTPSYTKPKPKPRVSTPTYHAPSKPKVVSALSNPKSAPSVDDVLKKLREKQEKKINAMFDKAKASQIAQLRANQEKATKQIQGQIGDVRNDFYDKRNQASVTSAQSARRLAELLANAGLTSSGENVTANVGLQSARQNALNQLNTMEGQQVGQLQGRIADINNPERLNQLQAAIEQQRNQALAGVLQNANDQAFNQNQFDQTMGWNFWNTQHQDAAAAARAAAQIQQYRDIIDQLGGNFTNGSGGGERYQSDLAQAAQRAGIPSSQIPYFNYVIQHESGFNPNAQNPNSSAHGYGQFLDSTVANYERKTGLNYSNPIDQLIMAYQYMTDRYGSPQGAANFWSQNHWY